MNKKVKLIALDIDGTIMDKNFHISECVQSTIFRVMEAGVKVILATGRMYSATVPIAKMLGITTPLIVYQGSLIQEFNNSQKILLHHTVPAELSLKVVEDLRNYGVQINAYINDRLFVENASEIAVEYATKRDIPLYTVDKFETIENFSPTKILGLDYNVEVVNKIRDEMKEKYDGILNITKSTQYFCEFVNNKCSKASAILILAKEWGIAPSEIMAIGDQNNDEEMLKIAGTSVAMGNADENLKKVADYITDTVDNNGAAKAIKKFVPL